MAQAKQNCRLRKLAPASPNCCKIVPAIALKGNALLAPVVLLFGGELFGVVGLRLHLHSTAVQGGR